MRVHRVLGRVVAITVLALGCASAAVAWQYAVPYERGADKKGKPQPPGLVHLWIPPRCATLRGLLVSGELGIERENNADDAVRAACADNDIGIVWFAPHPDGLFRYWAPYDTGLPTRFLAAFDALAAASGRAEVRRVPWITQGHSTAGIFCRNVAAWQPTRTAGVLSIKSGNFLQADVIPPGTSLVGMPLLALNGQFETFGPAAGILPEWGRETQWRYAVKELLTLRARDPQHLVGHVVQPGDDHFHGAPEDAALFALFLRKTAQYRLPRTLPPGDDPVPVLPLRAEDGWLADGDLAAPRHPPAPYAAYAGDRAAALWYYDGELAQAVAAFDRHLDHDQVIDNPAATFLDEGDGWTFRVTAAFLDVAPEQYGGRIGGKPIGHAPGPIQFRCKPIEPVVQVGPDTFRLLRQPTGKNPSVNVCGYHPGDDTFRATYRWGSLPFPTVAGPPQTITVAPIADLKPDAAGVPIQATASSGLPVRLEVDYGSVVVTDGTLSVADLPPGAKLPIACRITAYQIGRRIGQPVPAAKPVSVEFRIAR